ncbi:N-acetylglutamate synthase, CG3035 family [Antrihabitans cavernicola]|uniref:GNAT family N-acetyltransferase n=1 Tax=Antrihabitans cavernicola TaxID=2495913 RepID=A0A5A7SCC0_9NOCA|nr:GNAT family N-acetyltransferase [Spelaeibacter cavernicola]KAA0022135.1 GNAT family N-acetyltransferase [Spelaeibacter cavernicola]
MTTDPEIGSRVVMRYRLPPGYAHPMTDVIGELVSLDPPTVRGANGHLIRVAASRVVALKAVGVRAIRNSEIRALEHAAADGWPGLEREWLDGWLLRAGASFTGRANSAVPLHESANLSSLPRISRWYQDRGQRPLLLLPDRISTVPDDWQTWDEVVVLAADIENLMLPTGPSMVTVDDQPSAQWLSLYRYRGNLPPVWAPKMLVEVIDGVVGFGHLSGPDATIAVARATVTTAPDDRRWVGLTAVEVGEDHRRRGVGTLICAEMIRWGQERGATHVYLQVAAENEAALAMYANFGLVEHHRYRYATPPHE